MKTETYLVYKMEMLNVELEDKVMNVVELIADLSLMARNDIINRLVIDGLRYEYGLNALMMGRITEERGI